MTRLSVAGLIAAWMAAALPATSLAQPLPARSIAQREARLAQRIGDAEKQHAIGRRDADVLTHELKRIQRLDRYYRRSNGLSVWERRDLERRLKALSARLAEARRRAPREDHASENASDRSS